MSDIRESAIRRLWFSIGEGNTRVERLVRFVYMTLVVVCLYFFAQLRLDWPQQSVCGLLMVVLALVLSRSSASYLGTLTLVLMSLFATFRYGYWRLTSAWTFFHDPSNHLGALDMVFIVLLILGEIYAFVILYLGYFQTMWPLRRAPMPLPDAIEEWPHVDLMIPTYNEPLEVVRYTALGALNIDWPHDKLHIYLLDDGDRPEFEAFAREAGIGYMTRENNKHAKAGNINSALERTESPLVAIFDCDHVPTRSFLQITVGWFLRDKKLALVQTPHLFYSPDPFERNLNQFKQIPNEGELFYGVVQDGNDFWNATFFCGSCAVIRRVALDEVGGIATETVTEDAHTSLRLQIRGWNTAYINIPQAAGLATERLSAHIKQRVRWARGMIQVMRADNPLFAKGLTLPQRLCYFNAMLHFLYAGPRLIFMSAPLVYLFLSRTNIPGYWAAILAYALPHLMLANITNSRVQGQHRHSFWNEIYETVLSPYILLPTLLALINPKLGSFDVTAKGGVVEKSYFDKKIARPFLLMLAANMLGIAVGAVRFFMDPDRAGAAFMNVLWCVMNVIILGVAVAVAYEMRQMRQHVRIDMTMPVRVRLEDGRMIDAETADLSAGGVAIRLPGDEDGEGIPVGMKLGLIFPAANEKTLLPGSVVSCGEGMLRVVFNEMGIHEQEVLTTVLYTRADSWLGWGENRLPDQPLASALRIFQISLKGLRLAVVGLFEKEPGAVKVAGVLLLALMSAWFTTGSAKAQVSTQDSTPSTKVQKQVTEQAPEGYLGADARERIAHEPPPPPGKFRDVFSLNDTGSRAIEMRGVDDRHTVYFTLPESHVAKTAKIHLYYLFSPSLIAEMSQINVSLNGTTFASIAPAKHDKSNAAPNVSQNDEQDLEIPAELLARNNTLSFQFVGHYTMQCENPESGLIWAKVHSASYLDLGGDILPIADDLKHLPEPFLDSSVARSAALPVVFAAQPSLQAMEAAGVVASYLGVESQGNPLRLSAAVGTIPTGNAIVMAERVSDLPVGLSLPEVTGPTVAMRTNPADPFGKVLVLVGRSGDELLQAAQAVALRSGLLQGATVAIHDMQLPAKSAADDAPLWAKTDGKIPLWDYSSVDSMQTDGSSPISMYFRIPPDLYFNVKDSGAVLHVVYRYNSIPLAPLSSLQVGINDAFLASLPVVSGGDANHQSEAEVAVPVVNMRPFSNSLGFLYSFQLANRVGGDCKDGASVGKSSSSSGRPTGAMGAILRDSYLDMRGYPHWTELPNLEIFANAGFPFTRFADLDQTTVVLPRSPQPEILGVYLTMLAHFGRQTGYPAFRVTVADASVMQKGLDQDLLVIGSGSGGNSADGSEPEDREAFEKLRDVLPVSISDGQVKVREASSFLSWLHHAWWKLPDDGKDRESGSGMLVASGDPDAVIEGIESPYMARRSVVAVHLRDPDAVDPFLVHFLNVQQGSDIQGSVAVFHGSYFQSFRIGAHPYNVGTLPLWTALEVWFRRFPWMIALAVLAIAVLLASWARFWLRDMARIRLQATAK